MNSVDLVEEASYSYMEYAMSTIISRALPDIRDGLKPVQRRIIYAMLEDGLHSGAPFVKSVSIVGDTLKKYHPHGDQTVYGSLVNMAQPFNFRYPLVAGQGNFGSINDPQSPAAPRYTEAKMTEYCEYCVKDIDNDVVDFVDNFDGRYKEPEVLPVMFPNLLCNGAVGIAVGMSTNIPPHNLCEVIDATIALIKNPSISVSKLMKHIKGPDFPTGGYVFGEGLEKVYEDGKGTITLQARVTEEERVDGGKNIVITELPYRVSPDKIEVKIAELRNSDDFYASNIIDIKNLTDSRRGTYMVVELKNDADMLAVLERLFNDTDLRVNFHIDMKVVSGGAPKNVGLKTILQSFIDFRRNIVTRLLGNKMRQAEAKLELQRGLLLVLKNINKVIKLIQKSDKKSDAISSLMREFNVSERQAEHILNMPIIRLMRTEREGVANTAKKLEEEIAEYKSILSSNESIDKYIIKELNDVKSRIGDDRRTHIVYDAEQNLSSLLDDEVVVVAVSGGGYIKKMKLPECGIKDSRQIFNIKGPFQYLNAAKNSQYLLFFSQNGKVYRYSVRDIMSYGVNDLGIHLNSLLAISNEERIHSIICPQEGGTVLLITKHGMIKRVMVEEYSGISREGKAINLDIDDELCRALYVLNANDDVVILTANGKVARYSVDNINISKLTSSSVKGISLDDGDYIVDVALAPLNGNNVIICTKKGFIKKTLLNEYPATLNRGGKGVVGIKLNDDDTAVSLHIDANGLVVLCSDGLIFDLPTEMKPMGRATKGKLNKLTNVDIVDCRSNNDTVKYISGDA